MKAYIRSATAISPQNTFGETADLTAFHQYNTVRLKAIEPDYKLYLDPKAVRRMSRVIKMGVAAASACLQQANVAMPDAIITGTAYGCLEDTGVFLSRMIEQQEQDLSPTAFIQSTHNTVGAQIALNLQCHNYNNTFVHKGFSFESALRDSLLMLNEGDAKNILVGAIDELTDASFSILNRFDLFKKSSDDPNGTLAGEGAAFFVIGAEQSGNDLAVLQDLETIYRPENANELRNKIECFLNRQGLKPDDVDLVITGKNGDAAADGLIEEYANAIFKQDQLLSYKHLCGEYPTASGFALWLAVNLLSKKVLPGAVGSNAATNLKRVLICNQYKNKYYALMLLSAV